MISISKIVFTDKLDDRVNKCNNTYHSTTKTNVISDLKDEEIVGTFHEKKLRKKKIKKSLELKR